jgi:RNA polymerase sigma-70 factor (ECF subfamily)
MDKSDEESRILVNLWRAGDQQAAQALFDRYADQLLALARRRISQRMASRVDPEDVVQSVFRTFFDRAKKGHFDIEEKDDLVKLLVRITVHKTLRHIEHHKAAKRNVSSEAPQSDLSRERLQDLLDGGPTPDAVVAFCDQLDHFLNQLGPDERKILEMRLQNYSNHEIAQQLGSYDRRVRRSLEYIRGLLEQEKLNL